VEEAKADAPERRKEDIPKIRRVPAAMQAEGDGDIRAAAAVGYKPTAPALAMSRRCAK
jgi:hypothetical protein